MSEEYKDTGFTLLGHVQERCDCAIEALGEGDKAAAISYLEVAIEAIKTGREAAVS